MSPEKNGGESTPDANDRRTNRRFPLRLAVKYRWLGSPAGSDWAISETVNISSSGLLFATTLLLLPGQAVEACIAWPVWLDKHIPLKLAVKGPIVRNAGDKSAIRFERYEFKTAPAA
jgi:hypothetical protein